MDTLSYRTVFVNKATVSRKWYLVDAEGEVLGRLSSKVAKILMGKNKPDYTPHFNSGDKVVIVNAEKVRLTGKKMTDKLYVRHTGYPGGQKFRTPLDILHRKPEDLILHAVKGMLPKNRLQKQYLKNLHVYTGPQHPHIAQNPVKLEI
ncbi:MAG TPA: 50S ribosomal protein L13 [Bacteroidia bacterium]|nr:50S ribosomal protein L13 [Sphingobacteriales bacterium]HPD64752.1 50S ribosomal protein L13 [Bacteroidia bacterium]HRS59332.1 50S ribosomal protein L13 [Bacteroidia bacterium]HRU69144.1 50S ribosomal protein L13 [Bacteroidia bacterium]